LKMQVASFFVRVLSAGDDQGLKTRVKDRRNASSEYRYGKHSYLMCVS
jgi:hypothetical protein